VAAMVKASVPLQNKVPIPVQQTITDTEI